MSGIDDWIDRLIDALNAHDAVAVGKFMTEDVEYVMWQDDAWTRICERDRVVDLLGSFDGTSPLTSHLQRHSPSSRSMGLPWSTPRRARRTVDQLRPAGASHSTTSWSESCGRGGSVE